VVAENPPAELAGELRELLRASLPQYMIPASFVVLDAFPLSPNGKVDRNRLPLPVRFDSEQIDYVSPRTSTEEILAGIWAEILGLERVGIDVDFFKLGGHSLMAIQIIFRVREAFQIDLPLRRFFETRTIATLAETVEELILKTIDSLSEEEVRRFVQGSSAG
jgi:acyl carrier protein